MKFGICGLPFAVHIALLICNSQFSESRYGICKVQHPTARKHLLYKVNKDARHDISDNELLEKFYDTGDKRCMGILLQRYTLLLLGVCMKYLKNEEESKDAVQQVFLKVIIELQKYKVEYFKSWLYMVTRNFCLMKLRDKTSRPSKELHDIFTVDEEAEPLKEHFEKDKLLSYIELSLDELNNEQKTCLILFYLHKKTYHTISDETGFTLMQVKSNIQNGKRNLKILVEKKMKK